MPSLKKIKKDHKITTKEALIDAVKGSEKEKHLLVHFKTSSLDKAADALFSLMDSIYYREIELQDEKESRAVWDSSQRSIYNIEVGELNESKKRLENLLAKLL